MNKKGKRGQRPKAARVVVFIAVAVVGYKSIKVLARTGSAGLLTG